MNDDLTLLVRRWATAEGQDLANEIFHRLTAGKDLASLAIPVHEGRIDMRGIAAPRPDVVSTRDRNVAGRVFREERLANVPHLTGRRLIGIDFSYANLSGLKLTETLVEDCLFDHARLRDIGLWGCRVQGGTLRGSDLREAVLGGRWKTPTTYREISFESADLRECVPGMADFFDCDFSEARLDKVEFYANSFVSCRFAGPLREVSFSSRGLSGDKRQGAFESVDLSKAELDLCTFREISLDSVRLPQGSGHVVFRDYACAVGRALDELRDVATPEGRWLATLLEIHSKRMLPSQKRGVIGVSDLHPDRTYEAGEPVANWLRAIDENCLRRAETNP